MTEQVTTEQTERVTTEQEVGINGGQTFAEMAGDPMAPPLRPNVPAPQEDRSLELEQVEVYRTEVQITTQRAMMLEAKAREMQGYFKLARALAKTTMVRKEYQWNGDEDRMQPVHNLCAAMMYGAKLGIEPEDAGLLVITINDQPGLEAKTMVGIIKRWCDKRIAEGRTTRFDEGGDWIWEVEADDEHAIWAARRDGQEVSCEWTMDRALRADLTSENHKMQTRQGNTIKDMYGKFPVEMLRWRSATEAARLLFSDVLRGMQYSAEELRLIERTKQVPVETRPGGKGAAALERALEQANPDNHTEHRAGFVEGTVVESSESDSEQPADEAQATAPPQQPESATDDTSATEKTLTRLHTALSEVGMTDRTLKLQFLSKLVEREITTSKELTEFEAEHACDTLKKWKREGKFKPAQDQHAERASMGQLKELRALYKNAGMQGKAMLDHMGGVLGWNVDNINDLTDVDVREITKKLQAQAK